MFGLSLSKVLFTVFAVVMVWYGFRFVQRLQDRHRMRGRMPGIGSTGNGSPEAAETMTECKTCGSFIAASGARSCGRDACPYPG